MSLENAFDNLFPIWVYVYALFFALSVFSKAMLDSSVSCHNYAKIWFQKQYDSY